MKELSRHIVVVLATILIAAMPLRAQQEERGKYKSISKRNLRLEESVPVLLRDAEAMMSHDIEGALDKVEEALAQSLTQKSTFNEASCYLVLGKINQQIEDWDLAAENYRNAYQRFQYDYQSTPEFEQSLDGLVNAYDHLTRYDDVLKYLKIKLGVFNEPETRAGTQLQMAETYFEKGQFDLTRSFLEQAEKLISEIASPLLMSRAQAIRAKLLAQEDDIEGAERLYQQSQSFDYALDDLDNLKNEESYEESKEELISAYSRQGRVEDEINLRNQSITSNVIRKRPLKVAKEKQVLGRKYFELGNTSAAIRELQDAVELADSLGNLLELASTYKALAQAWEQAGNISQSLRTYRLYSNTIDEISREERVKDELKENILRRQQDILSLTKELALDESQYELERTSYALRTNQLRFQQFVIYGLLFLLLLAAIAVWLIYRNANRSKIRGQMLALKSLRSQMNPHFIFNALNSVNQYIALSDERSANKFLSEFSKLMRLVLDNSQQDFIPMSEEKEIIELYLKLEHNRFRDKFDYELDIDERLPLDAVEVPPMLIQPYIENAIWHGLRYKEEHGHLKVKISFEEKVLAVEIEDDGIGREKSRTLKTNQQKKHQSTGLKNTAERIDIINKVYQKQYSVKVTDVNGDETGTRVVITLPQNGQH